MLNTLQDNMAVCVKVLYELGMIDVGRKKLLLEGVETQNQLAYMEIADLLGLLAGTEDVYE